ncbi:glycosyltransferase family 10 domain-containing protein [Vibrio parahaemolyticus]|uniref:WclM n=2 Tax=Vibrio parahaemolyticus TaxID=670 RepID=A0A5Q5AX84_VIBPH|nr:glycosyltransferase family 10 [Vibrio parahaemolyticus]EGR1280594.1 hypothetical protein [Vibrio parahaemolyticus]EGR1790054.1 hypothetical protein [Vibrio parahaemolyticus]EGR1936181.1 hypothetical protein [Vibrio parahaemolyticus]EHK9057797.1 hypothetical protein [Vibrio parahaemolyticus]EHR0158116.1 hypothetical protein [Vibrio parahaemolyticus]
MKVALAITYHTNNKIFDLSDKAINRDNGVYPFFLLKEKLKEKGIDISTSDINTPEKSDLTIYFDYQKKLGFSKKNYLFLFESNVIRPLGWDSNIHDKFDKVFTWSTPLIDNVKYYETAYTHLFPNLEEIENIKVCFKDKKLVTLISGNKSVDHENELYSKRVDVIKWFEKNNIFDFEFYGIGWDRPRSNNKYLNYLFSKNTFLNSFFYRYKSYKGSVESKTHTLKNYKFCICFENAQMIEGYITEKIFDCFFSATVPIYWGAPDIDKFIPKDCYIDFRDFLSLEDLYEHISNMNECDYEKYINSAKNFLDSSNSNKFKCEYFVDNLVEHIVNDIKG